MQLTPAQQLRIIERLTAWMDASGDFRAIDKVEAIQRVLRGEYHYFVLHEDGRYSVIEDAQSLADAHEKASAIWGRAQLVPEHEWDYDPHRRRRVS